MKKEAMVGERGRETSLNGDGGTLTQPRAKIAVAHGVGSWNVRLAGDREVGVLGGSPSQVADSRSQVSVLDFVSAVDDPVTARNKGRCLRSEPGQSYS